MIPSARRRALDNLFAEATGSYQKGRMKHYWLMKSEPEVFSFNDLMRAPSRTTSWEGVRNYQARNFLRDTFKLGDEVLFYHSNTERPAVVGLAEVVRAGHPDLTALDKQSRYFDEAASKKGVSPWVMVDVKATAKFRSPVTRPMLGASTALKQMMVLKRGARLSVQPVTPEEFKAVCRMGGPTEL